MYGAPPRLDPRLTLQACALVGILDSDLSNVLSVDPKVVDGWHAGQPISERLTPRIIALIEATWTKMRVDADRRQLTPMDKAAIKEIVPAIRAATEICKLHPRYRKKYKRCLDRMLTALANSDVAYRAIVPDGAAN